jgi:hypothetical protein
VGLLGDPARLEGRRGAALSFFDLSIRYVDHRWEDASAKHRDSMTDALALIVPVLVKRAAGGPRRRRFGGRCGRTSCPRLDGKGSGRPMSWRLLAECTCSGDAVFRCWLVHVKS